MTTTAARDRRSDMVATLAERGALTDPAWVAAFEEVPRELFVPRFFLPRRDAPGWRLVEADAEWRDGVYTDDALVTQMCGSEAAADTARAGGTVQGAPTSSSSAPTLMARMLHALNVAPGSRVIEIGTGTGYNAALLAHRLGDGNVTTVEVDPDLTELARARLAAAGYGPTVVSADGAAGWAPGAPYDGLVSTVAVPAIPPAWLAQTRPGARLVVPLICAGHAGLMTALARDAHGGATGQFLRQYGGFMPVREVTAPPPPAIRDSMLDDTYPTDVPVDAVTGDHPAGFFLSLTAPTPYSVLGFTPASPAGAAAQTWGHGQDGSRFVLTTDRSGRGVVAAEGPLWTALEAAYADWQRLDRPDRDRFGLTVAPDGRHTIWLDTPDQAL